MGTPPYAAVSLERLLETRHRVVAVLTRPDQPSGRGKKMKESAVKTLATARSIEVLDQASPRDPALMSRLRELAPDIGVCVAYGRIVPRDFLELPRLGCINAHGSLLPHLRGAAPIERAILEGYSETGVTIMQMSEAAIDWSHSAQEIYRRVRAFAPSPGAFTFDAGKRLKVLEARPLSDRSCNAAAGTLIPASDADTEDESGDIAITVCCGNGALTLLTVQPEGKRAMSAADYLRGCRGLASDRRLGASGG